MKRKFGLLMTGLLFCGSFAAAVQAQVKAAPRGAAASEVTITGTVKNARNLINVQDMSELQRMQVASSDRTIALDSTGAFSITFPLAVPGYFRLGRNILYLTPGDRLTAHINVMRQDSSTFSGPGSAAATFLRYTAFPKAGSFIEAGGYIFPTPEATLNHILMIADYKRKQLDTLTGVTPAFKRLERARVKADVINSILDVQSYIIHSKTPSQEYVRFFRAMAAPVLEDYSHDFIDASLLNIEVYRDIAMDLVAGAPAGEDKQKITDYYRVQALIDEMNGVHDKQELPAFGVKLAQVQTGRYREIGEQYMHELMKFGKGDKAVDFTCLDIGGRNVKLSSLKGKVIYVDLWATWCGPCMALMPYMESLKDKYKDDPNVAFVSLSIDDEVKIPDWKKNVAQRKAEGYQWQVNRASLDSYNVTEIPRMILIDKDFSIIDLHAPLPASKEAETVINKALGK